MVFHRLIVSPKKSPVKSPVKSPGKRRQPEGPVSLSEPTCICGHLLNVWADAYFIVSTIYVLKLCVGHATSWHDIM